MTPQRRIRRLTLSAAVLGTLLVGSPWGVPAQPPSIQDLDAYVTRAVAAWETPGLSIAVVHGDSIVFAKGYGVRELGKPGVVDEHTLFAVGSTTKAMTVMALGMLADSGLIGWDDPVVRHLPRFRLIDPAVTAQTTVRDMLTHRSGLGTVDLIWYGAGGSVDDVIARLRHQPLASSPRSRYAYQNAMYATAGAVVEAVSGMSWDRFLRQRIFEPVGMPNARTSVIGLDTARNVATPHDVIEGKLIPVAHRNLDNIAPAGAVYAGARDMANWIRFMLDTGRIGGRRLLSERAWREMLTPQTLIPRASFYPTASLTNPHFTAYGLGWFLQDYHGEFVAMHTGSIDGMVAIVGLLPAHDVGVVVLANRDHAELRHALMWRVLDAYLGQEPRDWSTDLRALYDSLAERGRAAARPETRVTGTKPSLALAKYGGTFADSLYGSLTVRHEGGRLVLDFGPGRIADLEHWHYDTFRGTWRDPELGRTWVTFSLGRDGTVQALELTGYGEFELRR
jgi:CubicO group peptidase (beta-lactamase class C family)